MHEESLPISDIRHLKRVLSKASLARIEAARAEAGSRLLLRLAEFWATSAGAVRDLEQRSHFDLIPFFEEFAEPGFDAFANELLPVFPNVEDYVLHLSIHVMDEISNEIRPHKGLIMPRPWSARDWRALWPVLSDPHANARERIINILGEVISDPHGTWESYVGMSLTRHWLKDGFRDVKRLDPKDTNKVNLIDLAIQLRFRFPLRLFINSYELDRRLRAHLLTRLAFWEAKAHRRCADLQIESSTEQRSTTAVPSPIVDEDFGKTDAPQNQRSAQHNSAHQLVRWADINAALQQGKRRDAVDLWQEARRAACKPASQKVLYAESGQDPSEFYKWRRGEKPDGSQADKDIRAAMLTLLS